MEEEKGFEIRDRRSVLQEGDASSKGTPSDVRESPRPSRPQPESRPFEGTPPPITFSSFILSFATSGLMHLGQQAHPGSESPSVNLGMAQQTIDLLALLQEKTKGNLTPEEDTQLSQALYALRMTFVEVEKRH